MKFQTGLISSLMLAIGLLTASSSLTANQVLIEAKGGYFYPSDRKFREIYRDGGGIYGGEISFQLRRNIYAWGSANYFQRDGRSIGEHDRTTIEMIPVALGLKYFFPMCGDRYNFYLGAGGATTWLHLRDHAAFDVPHSKCWGFGGILKGGMVMAIKCGIFLDFFVDYTFMDVKFHNTRNGLVTRQHAHLDGVSGGLGLGYRF